jgi:hypothetical protein
LPRGPVKAEMITQGRRRPPFSVRGARDGLPGRCPLRSRRGAAPYPDLGFQRLGSASLHGTVPVNRRPMAGEVLTCAAARRRGAGWVRVVAIETAQRLAREGPRWKRLQTPERFRMWPSPTVMRVREESGRKASIVMLPSPLRSSGRQAALRSRRPLRSSSSSPSALGTAARAARSD